MGQSGGPRFLALGLGEMGRCHWGDHRHRGVRGKCGDLCFPKPRTGMREDLACPLLMGWSPAVWGSTGVLAHPPQPSAGGSQLMAGLPLAPSPSLEAHPAVASALGLPVSLSGNIGRGCSRPFRKHLLWLSSASGSSQGKGRCPHILPGLSSTWSLNSNP